VSGDRVVFYLMETYASFILKFIILDTFYNVKKTWNKIFTGISSRATRPHVFLTWFLSLGVTTLKFLMLLGEYYCSNSLKKKYYCSDVVSLDHAQEVDFWRKIDQDASWYNLRHDFISAALASSRWKKRMSSSNERLIGSSLDGRSAWVACFVKE
jgi:hypothetical protein